MSISALTKLFAATEPVVAALRAADDPRASTYEATFRLQFEAATEELLPADADHAIALQAMAEFLGLVRPSVRFDLRSVVSVVKRLPPSATQLVFLGSKLPDVFNERLFVSMLHAAYDRLGRRCPVRWSGDTLFADTPAVCDRSTLAVLIRPLFGLDEAALVAARPAAVLVFGEYPTEDGISPAVYSATMAADAALPIKMMYLQSLVPSSASSGIQAVNGFSSARAALEAVGYSAILYTTPHRSAARRLGFTLYARGDLTARANGIRPPPVSPEWVQRDLSAVEAAAKTNMPGPDVLAEQYARLAKTLKAVPQANYKFFLAQAADLGHANCGAVERALAEVNAELLTSRRVQVGVGPHDPNPRTGTVQGHDGQHVLILMDCEHTPRRVRVYQITAAI